MPGRAGEPLTCQATQAATAMPGHAAELPTRRAAQALPARPAQRPCDRPNRAPRRSARSPFGAGRPRGRTAAPEGAAPEGRAAHVVGHAGEPPPCQAAQARARVTGRTAHLAPAPAHRSGRAGREGAQQPRRLRHRRRRATESGGEPAPGRGRRAAHMPGGAGGPPSCRATPPSCPRAGPRRRPGARARRRACSGGGGWAGAAGKWRHASTAVPSGGQECAWGRVRRGAMSEGERCPKGSDVRRGAVPDVARVAMRAGRARAREGSVPECGGEAALRR
ncbi:Basic proline-rich protein precursor [[Actinomadura] parvosata subsp. kistnae]|nr:Basic proline-rich protein precursor [Actinomadura parvosata subsp. kistnae]